MLTVFASNRQEKLVDAFAELLKRRVGSPTQLELVAVQAGPMRDWLAAELARSAGIWAGAEILFPRGLIERLFSAVLAGGAGDWSQFGEESLMWSIADLLPGLLERGRFEDLGAYLEDDDRGLKRFQLARRIARSFDEYSVYRPEMVLGWERTGPKHWQAALWNALSGEKGLSHIAAASELYLKALDSDPAGAARLPRRISLFGISYLPPLFVRLLAATGRKTEVNLFTTCPSKEQWTRIHGEERLNRLSPVAAGGDGGTTAESLPKNERGLVAILGRAGRDFQRILEGNADYGEADRDLFEQSGTEPTVGLLKKLQADISGLRNRTAGFEPGERAEAEQPDESIRIHSCHGPLREVEVLKDQLLAFFDDERLDLRPEEVLVMMPNIEKYAPYIDAVFAGGAEGAPKIPYSMFGSRGGGRCGAADAFAELLAMVGGRATVEEVFDLLRNESVRARFALNEQDVALANEWVVRAGVRWGIDNEHRKSCGHPDFSENTWSFGLKRLFLGYAMPGMNRRLFERTLPYDEIEGAEAEVLGKFAEFVRALFGWLERLAAPRPLADWHRLLAAMFAEMVEPGSSRDHHLVSRALCELLGLAKRNAFEDSIDIAIVRTFFSERLDRRAHQGGYTFSGVTFSELYPAQGIPFKVICLMGMNEGDFPRSRSAPTFDLIAKSPRIGDRAVREDDRYVFLLALLSARERFVITYSGRDIGNNGRLNPSPVVEELAAALESVAASPQTLRDTIFVEHPLQPFSRSYFERGDDRRIFSYSNESCMGARSLAGAERGTAKFITGPLALLPDETTAVHIRELARFFKSPARYFVSNRLGISLGSEETPTPGREPVRPDPLDNYLLGESLLDLDLNGAGPDELYEVSRASGALPLGTAGRIHQETVGGAARLLADAFRMEAKGKRKSPLDLDLALNVRGSAVKAVGRVGAHWEGKLVAARWGSIGPKNLIEAWILHLGLLSAGFASGRSVLIGLKGGSELERATFSPTDRDPSALLADLIRLYFLGKEEPLRFFPDASFEYANARPAGAGAPADAEAVERARAKWEGSREREAQETLLVYRGIDPLEEPGFSQENEFKKISTVVFEPLLESLERR